MANSFSDLSFDSEKIYGAGLRDVACFAKEQIPPTSAMVGCRDRTSRHRTKMASATISFFLRSDAELACGKLGRA